jgi:hypothetical protein
VVFDVPPGYFRAVDARIVRGREFTAADTVPTLAATPAIVAESLAVALFRSGDPIGRRLRRISPYGERPTELEVVGVVRTMRESPFLENEPDLPPIFVPFRRVNVASCGRLVHRPDEIADSHDRAGRTARSDRDGRRTAGGASAAVGPDPDPRAGGPSLSRIAA